MPEDLDEFIQEFEETIDNAEMELVMAVGLFLRYDLEAEWMDESRRDYLLKVQSGADDADPGELDRKRLELLGISQLL